MLNQNVVNAIMINDQIFCYNNLDYNKDIKYR